MRKVSICYKVKEGFLDEEEWELGLRDELATAKNWKSRDPTAKKINEVGMSFHTFGGSKGAIC